MTSLSSTEAIASPAGAGSSPARASHKPSLPPGPRLPFPVQSFLFWQRLVPFLSRAQRRYGDVFTLRMLPWGRAVVIADPELVKEIMTGPPEVFRAGDANREVLEVLGSRGLLVVDEEEHLATRKRMLPPLHGESVKAYEQLIAELTAERLERWPVGKTISMHHESREITSEVILRAVFGAQDSPLLPELRRVLAKITNVTFVIGQWYVHNGLEAVPPWKGYSAAVKRTYELINQLIDELEEAPDREERTDMLSMLLRSGESDREWLHDQVMNLIVAGHETTTTGLSWAVELLARNPRVRAKARESDDAYLDAIVTETLRLRTVLPGAARTLSQPATAGTYTFPAGVTLLSLGVLMHRDARIYDHPDEFRPERWLEQRPGTYSWFPFGGGRRRCIGSAFAQMEMRVALRTMLDRLDWEAVGKRPERQKNFHISLIPARGARIVRTR
jgi:cytochrome P450 family 135